MFHASIPVLLLMAEGLALVLLVRLIIHEIRTQVCQVRRAEWYWAQKYYALRDEIEGRDEI